MVILKLMNGLAAEKGIFAIGDLTSGPWLAHKASHEAVVCVEKIKGLKTHAINKNEIPACTYSRPQVASIGLTEKKQLKWEKISKLVTFHLWLMVKQWQ